jgi:lipopolysaccharide transport system permease protein
MRFPKRQQRLSFARIKELAKIRIALTAACISTLSVLSSRPIETCYEEIVILQAETKPRRIGPPKIWISPNLSTLWHYRDMLSILIWRDFSVGYRQTLVGMAWVVITPLISMVVFSVFFGGLLKVPSNGIPYPLFSYAGLLPWTLFVSGTIRISSSLLANGNLISKIYFPRLIIPLSNLMFGILDFSVSFIILIVMMLFFGYSPTINIIWLPFLLLLVLVSSFGIGLWFATLSVQFRDASQILGFGLNILFYATPVIYPSSLLNGSWAALYNLNPMVGVVEGFRWALLGVGSPPNAAILISVLFSLVVVVSGVFYFNYVEQFFTDIM